MKRIGNLFEEVIRYENLMLAAHKASRRKKMKTSVARFNFHLESEIIDLQEELSGGRYRPHAYRLFEIREPKVRQICSSEFRDRVVHHAICNVMDPLLEKRLIFDTYACRQGKGAHAALKKAQVFSRTHAYFLKCDIQKYFESIDHQVLKSLLRQIIKDSALLELLDRIIDHAVPGSIPGKGIPIGNLTSQHFANFYLGKLDHFLKSHIRLKGYVRYMDDFICFSESKEFLKELLFQIREFVGESLKLRLKEKVTKLAPVSEGVPFLGFRVFPSLVRLQRTNLMRLRKKLSQREHQFFSGQIDERALSVSVNSMIAHISHANSIRMCRKEFERSLSLA